MTKDNEDALRCAKRLERSVRGLDRMHEIFGQKEPKNGIADRQRTAAAHLRRLVAENEALRAANADLALACRSWTAENEAKDALLRQAVEAFSRIDGWLKVRHMGGLMPDEKAIQAAIRQHLEGKA